MRTVERRWRAMGTDCHVVAVVDDTADDPTVLAAWLVERLEARWSRFRPTSDVRAVNAGAGTAVRVAVETVDALEAALAARDRTGGRFDPTVLAAVVAAGYDRSFELLPARPAAAEPAPAGAAVAVDRHRCTVTVAAGAGIDLGGIGKGLAADLVASRLLAVPGVAGACVNLGGDLRCLGAGPPPTPDAWGVALDGGGMLAVAEGGVATSTTTRRQWTGADGTERHHLVDPRTARPAAVGRRTATVIAGTAADAEVLATVAVLDPDALDADVPAVVVDGDAAPRPNAAMEAYLR